MAHLPNPRVCVIGAGLAGLTSARYLKDEGINFTVLESTRYVGGTWRYDSRIGTDENGLPLHTSMYKHLRTNLPKPTMELRGYPAPEDMPSFPNGKIFYEYIQGYVKYFDLEKHIKFLHNVILVSREKSVWKVKYQNVVTGEQFEDEFDFVIVGTGHYSKPNYPEIPGEELFTGTIVHSHDYREPERYQDHRVLVLGGGLSGMELAVEVSHSSKTLVHSHHSVIQFKTDFPKRYIRKPDVKEFTATGVKFVDGSYEDIDDVIYCTGFEYYYPFLDKSCGLELSPVCVTPLYKYMVNIRQPTMMLMGLIVRACLIVVLDAQSRYATALIKGNFTLPPQEVMMEEWNQRADIIKSKGQPPSYIHFLDEKEDEYYADLSEESGIERVPPVIFKIRNLDTKSKFENLCTYRDYAYTVIDDESFVRTMEREENLMK